MRNQMDRRVAMSACPSHNAARNQTFSIPVHLTRTSCVDRQKEGTISYSDPAIGVIRCRSSVRRTPPPALSLSFSEEPINLFDPHVISQMPNDLQTASFHLTSPRSSGTG